jgi:uncharacterized oligopeptide transporter (OPT) family protein
MTPSVRNPGSSPPLESQPLLSGGNDLAGRSNMQQNFTIRALIAGLLIGILVNLSNMYYGLQTGSSQQMPIVSALLGYFGFSLSSRLGFAPLSKAENVLIASVATATGCMPVTAGFSELIPALEYVLGPADGGPMRLRWTEMFLWSLGLCFFGILFAALLRKQLVVPRELPWPGATASSNVIRALYTGAAKTNVHQRNSRTVTYTAAEEENVARTPEGTDQSMVKLRLMLKSAAYSGLIVRFLPTHCNMILEISVLILR